MRVSMCKTRNICSLSSGRGSLWTNSPERRFAEPQETLLLALALNQSLQLKWYEQLRFAQLRAPIGQRLNAYAIALSRAKIGDTDPKPPHSKAPAIPIPSRRQRIKEDKSQSPGTPAGALPHLMDPKQESMCVPMPVDRSAKTK